ncbi:MAG: hypothetical protein UX61_C0008G0009 [Parcubacteria group bacterium GW2011_GWA2_46_7]|nr:MAG: hypothetical protein UX14_C0009G0003 [Parcubacteria group bacterium GW2011_GWF1_45_5]KKU11306.1 MAG: hypothetical protein UX15_C0010G0010 [Parcubacteria group bacterium GW2011_GWA1_45_7]KKU43925.1 MAG: hypothetical protein UX61_C0008G0009 [Parcubacteria group bacterium GW2011_GWA2_46_7]
MNPKKNPVRARMLLKNTRIIVWAGFVVVLLALSVFMWVTIENSIKKALSLRQEIVLVRKTLDTFSVLKTEKQQAEMYKEKLSSLFPTRAGLLRVLAYLEDRARFYRLQQFFSFGSEVPGTPQEPDYIGFNLSLSGGFPEFVRYLAEVEQSQALVSFSGIEILGKSKNVFQINTVGKIYIESHATSTE